MSSNKSDIVGNIVFGSITPISSDDEDNYGDETRFSSYTNVLAENARLKEANERLEKEMQGKQSAHNQDIALKSMQMKRYAHLLHALTQLSIGTAHLNEYSCNTEGNSRGMTIYHSFEIIEYKDS